MPSHLKHTLHRIIPVFFCLTLISLLTACTSRITVSPIVTPTPAPTLVPATATKTAQASVIVTDTVVITITTFTSQPEFGCFNNLTLPKQMGRILWPNDHQLYADSNCKKLVVAEGNKGAYLFATLPAPTSQETKYSIAWNIQDAVPLAPNGQKVAFTKEMQKYVEITQQTAFVQGQCLPIKIPANTYHIVWEPDLILFLGKTCSNSVPYQLINGQAHDIIREPTTTEDDYAILRN